MSPPTCVCSSTNVLLLVTFSSPLFLLLNICQVDRPFCTPFFCFDPSPMFRPGVGSVSACPVFVVCSFSPPPPPAQIRIVVTCCLGPFLAARPFPYSHFTPLMPSTLFSRFGVPIVSGPPGRVSPPQAPSQHLVLIWRSSFRGPSFRPFPRSPDEVPPPPAVPVAGIDYPSSLS